MQDGSPEFSSRLDKTNAAITAAVRAHGADNNPAVLAVLIEIARNLAIMADAASPIRKIRG